MASRSVALEPAALSYDKPLCASLDGFTLHAATRAGGWDDTGREALLRYVLRPPIAQEHVEPQTNGLVRIAVRRNKYVDSSGSALGFRWWRARTSESVAMMEATKNWGREDGCPWGWSGRR